MAGTVTRYVPWRRLASAAPACCTFSSGVLQSLLITSSRTPSCETLFACHCVDLSCAFLQDEISLLLQVETGDGSFSSSKLAVTVLGWASKYFIQLERESFCDALRACTIPGQGLLLPH